MPEKNHRLILLAILALAVFLRVAVALYLGDGLEETRGGAYDQISYDMLAQRVSQGHGFSFEQPWYTFAQRACRDISAVLQWVMETKGSEPDRARRMIT